DLGSPNLPVEIYGSWFDNMGNPVSGPVADITDGSGMLHFDFFSQPGMAINFDIHYFSGENELSLTFTGVACEACISSIPTLSFWTFIGTMLCIAIISIIAIAQPKIKRQIA